MFATSLAVTTLLLRTVPQNHAHRVHQHLTGAEKTVTQKLKSLNAVE
jgi:hypothetical protein